MKKQMKKVLALIVAGLLTIGAASTVLAEESRTYTVASPSNTNVVKDHTYRAYQIFTAGSIDADGKLGNVEWADGVTDTAKTALLNSVGAADLDALIEALGSADNDSAAATALAQAAYDNKTGLANGRDVQSGSTKLDLGYWIVVDESSAADVDVINWANLYVSDGETAVTVISKVDAPSSEKKVQDIDDSTETTASALQDAADYDIGDAVPYTLTATLPGNYDDYEHYYLAFVDDMSAGLTYNNDAKIYYGASDETGTAITASDAASSYTGGHGYKWEVIDLKVVAANLTGGDTVTIKYTATLNSNAEVTEAGNPNKMHIEYTSNPNNTGDGKKKPDDTGKTPDDINIVFTYKTVFNKVDGETRQPLTGADFTLYKKVDGEWVDVTKLNGEEKTNPSKTVTDNGSAKDATFTFNGLDDGEYKLVESETPDGYNTMDDIEFSIVAEHEDGDNPSLKSLEIYDKDGKKISGENMTFTAEKTTGTVEADITNNKGGTLPSTGGIGTTLFYVIGAVLVVAAGILLVTKRRMRAE